MELAIATYIDEGIVLRRVNYGEADLILTILTRGHGKIGAIARGVRKAKSRLTANTDLFVRSRMQFAKGRGSLDVLTQAVRLDHPASGIDAYRLAYAGLCAELSDRVLEEHHPDEQLFVLVADALMSVMDRGRDPRIAVVWFAGQMISRLGYAPEIHSCVVCHIQLAEEPAHFSASAEGLLCPTCSRSDPGAVECSVTVIKVLRIVARADSSLYWRLRLDDAELYTLESVVEQQLAVHLDRKLKSLDVVRTLSGMRRS